MIRFSIRDVLWLTIVVAGASAWCVDRWRSTIAVGKIADERDRAHSTVSAFARAQLQLREAIAARGLVVREVDGTVLLVDDETSPADTQPK